MLERLGKVCGWAGTDLALLIVVWGLLTWSAGNGGPLYFGVLAAIVVFLIGQARFDMSLLAANKSVPTRQRGMRIGIIVNEIFALAGCLRIPLRTCLPCGDRQSTN